MKLAMILLGILPLTLTACGQKGPTCTDEKAVNLARKAFERSVSEAAGKKRLDTGIIEKILNGANLAISGIRTESQDDRTGKRLCIAQLEATLSVETMATVNHPMMQAAIQQENQFNPLRFEQQKMIAEIPIQALMYPAQHSVNVRYLAAFRHGYMRHTMTALGKQMGRIEPWLGKRFIYIQPGQKRVIAEIDGLLTCGYPLPELQ